LVKDNSSLAVKAESKAEEMMVPRKQEVKPKPEIDEDEAELES
jgi:hypothetical protein